MSDVILVVVAIIVFNLASWLPFHLARLARPLNERKLLNWPRPVHLERSVVVKLGAPKAALLAHIQRESIN